MNSSDYYYDKGLTFLNEENYEEALMYIDKAIEMDKSIPDYLISKSKCLSGLKMDDEALECLDISVGSDDSILNYKVKLLCEQSRKFMEEGNFIESFFRLDSASVYAPDDEEVISLKIKLFSKEANNAFKQGEYDAASGFWEKVIELDPDNPIHYYNKANVILKESFIYSMKSRYNYSTTENGLNIELISNYLTQAEMLIKIAKNFTKAIEYLAKTDSFEDYMPLDKLSKKASLLSDCGCFDDGIRCLDKALFKWENQGEIKLYDEKSKIELLNRKANFLNIKSINFALNEQYEESMKCLEEALSISKSRDQISTLLKNKGINHIRLFQFEEALNCLDEALENKNIPNILFLRCSTLKKLKRYDEAFESIDSLMEEYPNDIGIICLKASLLFLTDDVDSAIELCENSIEKNPDGVPLQMMIDSINTIKTIRNALKYINKSIEIGTANEEVFTLKNNLELEEVIELIEIDAQYALECLNNLNIDKNDVNYLNCKSRIFKKLEKLIKSDEYLIRALEIIN